MSDIGGLGMRQSARISVAPVNDSFKRLSASDVVFRLGRVLLIVEGLAIGVLGGVALAWSMGYTPFSEDGIPMLGLKVTPPHAGLLLIVGTLALLACLGRRTALIFSALTAFGWAALSIVCAFKVAHHTPGVLGFDPRDGLLYGALCAYNIVTASCLALAVLNKSRSRRLLAI